MARFTRQARTRGRQAANSSSLEALARAGFIARGVIYVLIGFIAAQIALGHGGTADRGGALQQVAAQGYGPLLLWLLALGFGGLALWRLSEAAFGAAGPKGHGAPERLKSLGRAVLYGFFCLTTVQLVTGASAAATQNGNHQSRAVTAQLMSQPGGRFLVGLIGVGLVVAGALEAQESWTEAFMKRMSLGAVRVRTAGVVRTLGRFGGLARAAVFALAGVFLVVAAVQFAPSKAEGIDGTLRAFAHTPLGPPLLMAVAIGLVAFGIFSWCEARWRRI